MILLLDTQRPDAESLPGGIRANVGVRFCLRVRDQVANDMVLPTSSYKAGIRATDFAQADKGIGWLIGHADAAEIVRTYYCDAVQADAIGRRARRLREAAGTLSGYALGEHEAQLPTVDLLADVLVVTEGADKVWSETIAARLAGLRPEFYRGWDATSVGDALRVRGVEPGQVWGQTATSTLAEYLWGPGAWQEATAWLQAEQPRQTKPASSTGSSRSATTTAGSTCLRPSRSWPRSWRPCAGCTSSRRPSGSRPGRRTRTADT